MSKLDLYLLMLGSVLPFFLVDLSAAWIKHQVRSIEDDVEAFFGSNKPPETGL